MGVACAKAVISGILPNLPIKKAPTFLQVLDLIELFGGLGRNRTADTRIFNPQNAIFGRFFELQTILNHSPTEIT